MKHLPLATSIFCLGFALCSGLPAQGPTYTTIGAGCPGSAGTPVLENWKGDLPFFDSTFSNQLLSVPDTGMAIALLGLSRTDLNGTPLPLDLSIVDMPGCQLFTDILRTTALDISSGRATWTTDIPAQLSLMGLSFYQQVVVFDASVPGLGAIMSNAAEGVVGDLPELELSGTFSVSPTRIEQGTTMRLPEMAVTNLSSVASAGAFSIGYFLSDTRPVRNSGVLLGTFAISGLAPGESAVIPFRSNGIPLDTLPGDYWVGIVVDWEDEVRKRGRANDERSVPLTVTETLPDLLFMSGAPTISPNLLVITTQSGSSFVDVTSPIVENEGSLVAGNFSVGCYLSTDVTITTSDTLLHSVLVRGLSAGGYFPFPATSFHSLGISNRLPSGTYWIGFIADHGGVVRESDEANNASPAGQLRIQKIILPFPEK